MKEKDYMEAKDWAKKSRELKDKYDSYIELRQHAIDVFGIEYVGFLDITSENQLLVTPDHTVEGGKAGHANKGNAKISYNILDDGSLVLFKASRIIDELVPLVAEHVDREALIRDVLNNLESKDLKELHERMIATPKKTKKRPSVKQRPGCQYLSIGGKSGRPMNLFIRD